MGTETASDGKAVFSTSNFDELVQYLEKTSGRERPDEEELRPVHVLTIDDPARNDGWQRDKVPLGEGLAASIALSGRRANEACVDDCTSDLFEFRFDRNFPWKTLPLVTAPNRNHSRFRILHLETDGSVSDKRKNIAGLDSSTDEGLPHLLRENVKVLVVASYEMTDEYLSKSLVAWDGHPDDKLPMVIHHGPEGGCILPAEQVSSARNRFQAEARFLYNHATNFSILARRALFKIYFDERLPRHEAARRLPSIGFLSWRWAHPFFLQVLHYLRRLGRIGTNEHRERLEERVTSLSFAHLYANGIPVFGKSGRGFDLTWNGTGSYPAWREELGRVLLPAEESMSLHFHHRIFDCFQHVESMGILGLDGNDIVLSPWGVKFLDIMGPETEDPDVLLRWRTPAGDMGTPADVKAMDRWINRTFRSVKRRVAGYREEMALLDDPAYLANTPISQNRLSLVGIHLPVDDASLLDTEFAAEIARIARAEQDTPLKDRRIGLVHEPPRLGADAKMIGLWIGVPISVTHDDPLRREPGWLMNLSGAKNEALLAVRSLSRPIMDRIEGLSIGVVHDIPTPEALGDVCSLDWNIQAEPGDVLRCIISGITSTIDMETAPDSIRRVPLISRRDGSFEPEIHVGINHFRGKGNSIRTATCGLFVGVYNETKGTHFIDPNVHPEKARKFEIMKPRLLGNLASFLEVNRTEQGFWAVLSDGTVKRIDPPAS